MSTQGCVAKTLLSTVLDPGVTGQPESTPCLGQVWEALSMEWDMWNLDFTLCELGPAMHHSNDGSVPTSQGSLVQ